MRLNGSNNQTITIIDKDVDDISITGGTNKDIKKELALLEYGIQ